MNTTTEILESSELDIERCMEGAASAPAPGATQSTITAIMAEMVKYGELATKASDLEAQPEDDRRAKEALALMEARLWLALGPRHEDTRAIGAVQTCDIKPMFHDLHTGSACLQCAGLGHYLIQEYAHSPGAASVVCARCGGSGRDTATAGQAEPVALANGFLADVMTAAGLLEQGKQCKALANRLSENVMQTYAAPSPEPIGEVVEVSARSGALAEAGVVKEGRLYRDVPAGTKLYLTADSITPAAVAEPVAIRFRFHYPDDAPPGHHRTGDWRYVGPWDKLPDSARDVEPLYAAPVPVKPAGEVVTEWLLVSPSGYVQAREASAAKAWARWGGYKVTVETMLAIEQQGWKVITSATTPSVSSTEAQRPSAVGVSGSLGGVDALTDSEIITAIRSVSPDVQVSEIRLAQARAVLKAAAKNSGICGECGGAGWKCHPFGDRRDACTSGIAAIGAGGVE